MKRLRRWSWLIGLSFLGVLALLADITGVVTAASPWAQNHWWVGYLASLVMLAVVCAVVPQTAGLAHADKQRREVEARAARLERDNASLRQRVADFAPSASPEHSPGAPVLKLSEPGLVARDDEPDVVYSLANWSRYDIWDLVVQSATPDVDVVGVTSSSLHALPDAGLPLAGQEHLTRPDALMVTVRFRTPQQPATSTVRSGGLRHALRYVRRGRRRQGRSSQIGTAQWRVPWEACITYGAVERFTHRQSLP